MGVSLAELTRYLDDYLEHAEFDDYAGAHNGLQVEAPGPVGKVAAAVDACGATIEGAAAAGAQLLVVHHGLFWGGVRPITGGFYRRLRRAFDAGVAIYSSHLPLDAHPEVGNNAELARAIGASPEAPLGSYQGQPVGLLARLDEGPISRAQWHERVERALGGPAQLLELGPATVERFGVVTGAGSSCLGDAERAGAETLLTGEAPHHAFHDAEERGINLCLGGHYATETFGVRALAAHLAARFDLEWTFIDHPTGL